MRKSNIFLFAMACIIFGVITAWPDKISNQINGTSMCEDNNLRLELMTSNEIYQSDEAIKCYVKLSYIGEENSFIFYSGSPVIMFALEGGEYFNGEWDLMNKGLDRYEIFKKEPVEYAFKKYMGNHLNTDTRAVDFWRNFMSSDELKLDPGEYKIFARVSYYLIRGGEEFTITASKKIIVN